jgi:hypothetical protein
MSDAVSVPVNGSGPLWAPVAVAGVKAEGVLWTGLRGGLRCFGGGGGAGVVSTATLRAAAASQTPTV